MSSFLKRFVAAGALLMLVGQGCTKGLDADTLSASKPATLNIWGVIDDANVYSTVLAEYREQHPNVQLNYRRFRLEEYEDELINALAEDRGPDIFLIHNDWTGKYLTKILPMPAATKVAYSVVQGTLRKEMTWVLQTEPSITNKVFRERFADVVLRDAMRTMNVSTDPNVADIQQKIVGIPVSVDTMALFYNKDLLNAAGIPTPPETWSQFQEQAKKLTKLGAGGSILQSAAGIGTAYNVERAVDLVTALMVQNGADMADAGGRPAFDVIPAALSGQRSVPPSYQALQFYTDFANPSKETYTWSGSQPNSLEAFIAGKAAFFFGYSYHLDEVRARAPRLNLGISKMPQIDGNPVKNVANYWFWTVSKKTKNANLAWNFLNYLAKPENAKKVLDIAKRPAAIKSLLPGQLDNEDVGVFAAQVLTAVSWYTGRDPQAADRAILQMINTVVAAAAPLPEAIRFAVTQIGQTY